MEREDQEGKRRIKTVDCDNKGREEIKNTKSETQGQCLCLQQKPSFRIPRKESSCLMEPHSSVTE